MAALRFIVLMRGTAFVAHIDNVGRKSTTLFRADTGRNLRSIDSISSALVVDQTAWPKLGDSDESRALQISGVRTTATHRRNVGIKRQSREIVAREKAFGR